MKGRLHIFYPFVLVFILTILNETYAQSKSKTSKQIGLLIKEKNSRKSIQKKIDSQLLQAIREKQGKKMSRGVELEPVNIGANNNGNLKVDISANVTDSLLSRIKDMGGIIIYPSKEHETIRAEINLSMVEKIAAFPEVRFISAAADPQLNHPFKSDTDIPGISTDVKRSDSISRQRP